MPKHSICLYKNPNELTHHTPAVYPVVLSEWTAVMGDEAPASDRGKDPEDSSIAAFPCGRKDAV